MRISDWSSDVCSSDLSLPPVGFSRGLAEPSTAGRIRPRLGRASEAGASGQPAVRIAVEPTDIRNPDTFHKVVDCQWACPAHTPVPEYIRLIAPGRHADAYMVNWHSNVFPGLLGRTDRTSTRLKSRPSFALRRPAS